MRIELNPCYVLHQRPYRETSTLLEIFSSDYGRISLIARGIKTKNKNNLQGLLQPFQKLMVSWSGKGNLPALTKVENIEARPTVSNNIFMTGFYVNELLIRLLHKNEQHEELFQIYEATINGLKYSEEPQPILRRFEKQLLQSLGYGLVLDHTINENTPIDQDQDYYYTFQMGPSLKPPEQGEYIVLSGRTLLSINSDQYEDKASLKEARNLMRYILNCILGNKPLQSRQLYQSFMSF